MVSLLKNETCDWSPELTLRLIDMYKVRSVLWDPKHPDFTSPIEQTSALKKISHTLGINRYEVARKITELRNRYSREREIIFNTSDRSRWIFYKALYFLADNNKPWSCITPEPQLIQTVEPKNVDELLIELIKKYEALYNPTYQYILGGKNQKLRKKKLKLQKERAWKLIGSQIRLSPVKCKSTWLKIRHEYIDVLKNRCYVKLPDQTSYILTPPYKYEKQLQFYLPYLGDQLPPQFSRIFFEDRNKNTIVDPKGNNLQRESNCVRSSLIIPSEINDRTKNTIVELKGNNLKTEPNCVSSCLIIPSEINDSNENTIVEPKGNNLKTEPNCVSSSLTIPSKINDTNTTNSTDTIELSDDDLVENGNIRNKKSDTMKRIEVIILNDDGTENSLEPIELDEDEEIIFSAIQVSNGHSLVGNNQDNNNKTSQNKEKDERTERIKSTELKKTSLQPSMNDQRMSCSVKVRTPLKDKKHPLKPVVNLNSLGNSSNDTSNNNNNNKGDSKKQLKLDEKDELIMHIGNEKIKIPVTYVDDDDEEEIDNGGLYIKVRASNEEKDKNDDNDSISVEIDLEEVNGDEIELSLEDFIDDVDIDDQLDFINDELEVEVDPSVDKKNDDQVNLVTEEKYKTSRKRCRCNKMKEMDDEESEEYFYSGLALTANQIASYSDRLQLRMELTKCVMSALSKSLENGNKSDIL